MPTRCHGWQFRCQAIADVLVRSLRIRPVRDVLVEAPLLVGLIICSTGSGIVIARAARYPAFPIVGTALTTVGMALLSQALACCLV
jgi:hypothetical protein